MNLQISKFIKANSEAMPRKETNMTLRKLISTTLAALFVVSAVSGCKPSNTPTSNFSNQNMKEIRVTVLGGDANGTKTPQEDKLTPIWRKKTMVIPEFVSIPPGQDAVQWLQGRMVSNDMPEVISVSNGIFDNPNVYDYIIKSKGLRPFTLEEMKQYMPRIQERLKKYNVTIEEWYKANADPNDGKLYYIPGSVDNNLVPEYRKLPSTFETIKVPYAMYLRDDILKKIYPEVKTESELMAVYRQKGELTYEDISDIPIKNKEQFLDYLMKVKELNIKVNAFDVIPANPLYSGNNIGALMWSNYSFPGFWWDDKGLIDRFITQDGKMVSFCDTPEWKSYISWMNKAYNNRLLGEEIFIQTNDQQVAKIKSGIYASFQSWLDVTGARQKSKKDNLGYGYRLFYTFDIPLKTKYQDVSEVIISLKTPNYGVGISRNTDESKIKQILNWIDWNASEEAATLRSWGTPDMYTGEGLSRRFKAEYKDIEDQALSIAVDDNSGIKKNGVYYGMYFSSSPGDILAKSWNETYGLFSNWFDPYKPSNAYPVDLAAQKTPDIAVANAMRKHYLKDLKYYALTKTGDDLVEAWQKFKEEDIEYTNVRKNATFDSIEAQSATVKAIIGPIANFEKEYKNYEEFLTQDYKQSLMLQTDLYKKFLDIRKKYLKPMN